MHICSTSPASPLEIPVIGWAISPSTTYDPGTTVKNQSLEDSQSTDIHLDMEIRRQTEVKHSYENIQQGNKRSNRLFFKLTTNSV